MTRAETVRRADVTGAGAVSSTGSCTRNTPPPHKDNSKAKNNKNKTKTKNKNKDKRDKDGRMNLALWITTGLLAAVALTGGVTKAFVPKEKLAAAHGGGWTAGAGTGFVKGLGVLELLAAAGLILPAALGVAPVLVPVTAVCWVALMIGAMITHRRLGEYPLVALNAFYLALAAFIAWGRTGPGPFTG
ncbi:DoxX family protein [Streptomyces sp. NPDC088785]|uniref:DoxX family protein n=1 Tax=Streptomyces sp. NPDC088785 TaxID=3365897 RepID=UPI00382FBE06